MELAKAKVAYRSQRSQAKKRGIEWGFTFDTWMAWWGDDLDQRGVRPWSLQMQRPCDSGPYAPGNVRKGCPRQNQRTRGAMQRRERQAKLDTGSAVEAGIPTRRYREVAAEDDAEHVEQMLGIRTMYDTFF